MLFTKRVANDAAIVARSGEGPARLEANSVRSTTVLFLFRCFVKQVMQFIDYSSDGEEPASTAACSNLSTRAPGQFAASFHHPVNSAPVVALVPGYARSLSGLNSVDSMSAPLVGPVNPFKTRGSSLPGVRVSGMGQISEFAMNDYSFHEQFTSYERDGFALDSSTNEVLGDYNKALLATQHQKRSKSKSDTQSSSSSKGKKRSKLEDLGDGYSGPWAPPSSAEVLVGEQINSVKSNAAAAASVVAGRGGADVQREVHSKGKTEAQPTADLKKQDASAFIVLPEDEGGRTMEGPVVHEVTSTFHGQSLVDYQGRSWMTPPPGVRSDGGDHESFIPKKCTKKFTGHTKGVQAIEFFPGTGHLLLSASLDGQCKIWDVYGDKNVRRTFHGHSEAVRSVHLSNSGSHFLSSGFDRIIRQWDVETGQATGTFSNLKMGYQVKYYPKDNNIFLVAASDNRVYQWDARDGKICQEYNYHLEPCNTITFFDNATKFASTSDDKKILIWEYDIPVPIKYIAEPDMHSIPAVSLHPAGTHLAGQSMDNKIVVYSCGDKVKLLRKKVFEGHNNSGYACQVGFSPRGNFIISGDGLGMFYVWDWSSTRLLRKFRAHDNGPCIGAVFNPLSPSMIATCGWDGLVKLFE